MGQLERIKSPEDLKKLSMDQLATLAEECRGRIFEAVSKNGGHLGSNLWVVELTISLYYVYDFWPHNAGTVKRSFATILNVNGMSISKPQGAFAAYLERVRISTTYDEAKRIAKDVVHRLPSGVGNTIEAIWHHLKEGVKSGIWPGHAF